MPALAGSRKKKEGKKINCMSRGKWGNNKVIANV